MIKFSDLRVGQTLKCGTVLMTVVEITEKQAVAVQQFNGRAIQITLPKSLGTNPHCRPMTIV